MSNEAATVSSTPSLPACPNAIEPTAATISSTLRTFIETKLTPSLEKLNTSISIESSTNSVSSTDCVCSNEETVISRVITAGSVVKTSSNHASGKRLI